MLVRNEITLNTPVQIDASQDLWFGYEVTHSDGENPAGVDAGPAIQYKGDMISFDASSWVSMSAEYGLDYNWNLAGYVSVTADGKTVATPLVKDIVQNPAGQLDVASGYTGSSGKFIPKNEKSLLGFNVYRDGDLLGFTTYNCYTDLCLPPESSYTYNITAVYDQGESEPSDALLVTIPAMPAPTGLTLTLDEGNIVLNWNGVKGFDGYNVYHSFDNGSFELLNSQPQSATVFTYDDPDIGYHEFKITAMYCEFESGASNTEGITITGIDEHLSVSTKIYPNPVSDIVNISSETLINRIKLFSNIGQIVLDTDVQDNNYLIDMSGFEKGIYLIKVETNNGVIAKTLIKR
jgi:hypothetical protein